MVWYPSPLTYRGKFQPLLLFPFLSLRETDIHPTFKINDFSGILAKLQVVSNNTYVSLILLANFPSNFQSARNEGKGEGKKNLRSRDENCSHHRTRGKKMRKFAFNCGKNEKDSSFFKAKNPFSGLCAFLFFLTTNKGIHKIPSFRSDYNLFFCERGETLGHSIQCATASIAKKSLHSI